MEKIFWLKKAEIFSSLTEEELEVVGGYSHPVDYAEEALVFDEGGAGDALFIVLEGSISIARKTGEGGFSPIAELIAGDSFGELEFLIGNPRNARATASSPAVLLRFPEDGVRLATVLERHPAVGTQILFSFLKTISSRMRASHHLLKENSSLVQELKRQVYGDKLTGLYNKTYLEETLPSLLRNPSKPVALFLMKPDNFKQINDTYGHEAGDETLKLMATELALFFGERGTSVRYMGNELGVILPDKPREAAAEEAKVLLARLQELDISAATGHPEVRLSVSIGIAVHPDHGKTSDDLIAAAHALPLVGRSRGGNTILFPEDAS